MKVLFAGTPAVAVPSLDRLLEAGFEVVGVLTRPDAPLGRKRILTPSPVAQRAEELGLEVIKASRITPEVTDQIVATGADVGAIVAFGGLVPQSALGALEHGWINLHFSLLPAWRGAAPVQHALINGDDVLGASTFQLEAGLDTGPVFGTMTETARPDDTSGVVLERLAASGAVLLAQTLSAIAAGRAEARPQEGTPTLAPKLTLEDGRLDWSQPALSLHRRARGVTPEPGAWTELDGQRFKIGSLALRPDVRDLAPGTLRLVGKSVVVGTGSHGLELLEVQPSGKRMMSARDWARGLAALEKVTFA
ncbi:methionyl-tRNA formyltransferase [Arthrobacter woluwensis]|uniref:methionyl-tRNA formyltransferase n=1 Tax=Arthrobacter woluwensis TaxID=156980 RepID=UPI000D11AF82|nr:methionyl-tRNA formyltransferase [Arthrobacter woluwensis]PSS45291.1 methionyl-tRNA formyltransferase [Arthrobacter woluwensis]